MAPSQPHTALCVRHRQGEVCLTPAPELQIMNPTTICSGSVCILAAPYRRRQQPQDPLALLTAALPLATALACPSACQHLDRNCTAAALAYRAALGACRPMLVVLQAHL